MKDTHLLYIILAVFICIGTVSAQTPKWVSTEVQNRAAVLEKFTGGFCTYCADGDRIANNLAEQYSDKFIIVSIHIDMLDASMLYGNYLKTDEGELIYEEATEEYDDLLQLYLSMPVGTINRSTEPWTMSRDKWDSTSVNIMNQSSIVNVYVKPKLDYHARELTVEVEYYYTDDYLGSENYLTVMLLQNEIARYQFFGKKYNPDYTTDDGSYYRHMHVLRKIISEGGVWGDTITNTIKGDYGYRKYTLILPDSINSVPLDLANLEVAAFISESKSNIYTGHKAAIEIPKYTKTDLALEDVTEYNNTLKFETIKPKFKITNNSDAPVTTFDIEYSFYNTKTILNLYDEDYNFYDEYNEDNVLQKYDTLVAKADKYSGIINKGESIIFEFPEITRDDYKYSSFYIAHASISNIYSNDLFLLDVDSTNNTTETTNIGLIDTVFSEIEFSFENADTSSNELLPAYIVFDKSLNPYFTLDKGYGGAKNTRTAVLFLLNSLYHLVSNPGYMLFGEIDCKDNPNKILTYYYAYSDGRQTGTSPRIVIDISKDFGKTWQRISDVFCKETGVVEDLKKVYVPVSDEYKQVKINLSEYAKENFIMRIGGIPGSNGNALWIDEISIKNAPEESIEENTNLSIYPNPTANILYINNDHLLGEEYKIYDMSGKMIINGINNTNEINVETLNTGTYSLKIKDSIFNFIKK